MRRYDILSSIGLGIIGLGFCAGGIRLGFGSWQQPSPGFLPLLAGSVLFILSLALWIEALRSPAEGIRKPFWEREGAWKTIGLTFLGLVGYLLFFRSLGFITVTFFFALVMLRCIGGKGWWTALVVAALLSLASYGLFAGLLGTSLPKGKIYGCDCRDRAGISYGA